MKSKAKGDPMAKDVVLALVHEDARKRTFGISFPDFPGCISGGDDFAEALERGRRTLAFHLQSMADDGEEIPRPTDARLALESASEEIGEGALPVLLEVEFPGRAVRVNISIEEGLLSQVDRAAAASGQTRSAFLADAARARLRTAA